MEANLYFKTPRAWEALARRDGLGRRAHTLLLMANGRRSLRELSRLLDEDVHGLAAELAQQGYLQTHPVAVLAEAEDESLTSA